MNLTAWILTGSILGSMIVSQHDTEEACLGRKAVLQKEKNVTELQCAKPVNNSEGYLSITPGGSNLCCGSTGCGPC